MKFDPVQQGNKNSHYIFVLLCHSYFSLQIVKIVCNLVNKI
jgi:hypothetical protein